MSVKTTHLLLTVLLAIALTACVAKTEGTADQDTAPDQTGTDTTQDVAVDMAADNAADTPPSDVTDVQDVSGDENTPDMEMTDGTVDTDTDADVIVPPSNGEYLSYATNDGQVWRIEVADSAVPENLAPHLDALAMGSGDSMLVPSRNGEWFAVTSERFAAGCLGWACLIRLRGDFSGGEAIFNGIDPVHTGESAHISNDGNTIVVDQEHDTLNRTDIVLLRQDQNGTWSTPINLTQDPSPYDFHEMPRLSWDGARVVFNCADQPYIAAGTSICMINTDGTGFRRIAGPGNAPIGLGVGTISYQPDFEANGDVVFTGDFGGAEQLFRWHANDDSVTLVSRMTTGDVHSCVLPSGRIASLWWDRPDNDGNFPDLKVMDPDGTNPIIVLSNTPVYPAALACGPYWSP